MGFVESFATCSYGEGNAVFKEYRAEFGDRWGAVHVRHWVVNGTYCGAGFDASESVDCADLFHSEENCC